MFTDIKNKDFINNTDEKKFKVEKYLIDDVYDDCFATNFEKVLIELTDEEVDEYLSIYLD